MAYDAVRAQLDKLLGPDRNGPLTSSAKQVEPHYNDSDVCKYYLLGFCPNDLSIKQRSEPGSCPNKHSDIAKKKFETDLNNGKANVNDEKIRWTRQLLTQCRSILAVEDRKIRNSARRLQESFQAQGDLSGLMIRNFDTLKALGMVSKDAKVIPYNSKDSDNEELFIDQDPTDNHENNQMNSTDNEDENSQFQVKVISKSSNPKSNEDSTDSQSETENQNDNDDDLDGFGIIKVIPKHASQHNKDETHPSDESNGKSPKQTENSEQNNVNDEGKSNTEAEKTTPSSSTKENDSSESKEGKTLNEQQQQDTPSKEMPLKEQSDVENDDTVSPKDKESSTQGETSNKSVMDKYYEAGVGPDGLLMLDRKRSQRVCACCGGCISLVDAEPRLLSHYGGKAHQSLVLLRRKINELEELMKNDAEYIGSDIRRNHGYSRHGQDINNSRSYERNESAQQGRYGWKARNRSRRGHGTNDWYQNALNQNHQESGEQPSHHGYERSDHRDRYNERSDRRRRYDDRYEPRYDRDGGNRYEDRYGDEREDRQNDRHSRRHGGSRHERSRKRHRTPSPSRRDRRFRR